MLHDCVVEQVSGRVFLSWVFTMPKKDSLATCGPQHMNCFVLTQRFRMLTVSLVQLALRRVSWFTAVDLESAYWQIPIHPRFCMFLAVQVGHDTFQFKVLTFSLNIAPRVLMKLMKVVVQQNLVA